MNSILSSGTESLLEVTLPTVNDIIDCTLSDTISRMTEKTTDSLIVLVFC